MKKDAFMIMPFSGTNTCSEAIWTENFENVFKPAFEEMGYSCERAMPETGSLIKSIIKKLNDSYIVLADITDRNANVFYELGVRHTLSKRTIIISQNADHIPSDLRGYWTIIYSTNPAGVAKFKSDIKNLLLKIEQEPFISDSPVSDFIDTELYGISNKTLKSSIKKLIALKTEITGNTNTINKILGNNKYISLIDHVCLDLYVTTIYIDLGSDFIKNIYEYRSYLRLIKENINIEDSFLKQIIEKGRGIIRKIDHVIIKISHCEFEEPIKITSAQWTAVDDDNVYSKITPVEELNLDEL